AGWRRGSPTYAGARTHARARLSVDPRKADEGAGSGQAYGNPGEDLRCGNPGEQSVSRVRYSVGHGWPERSISGTPEIHEDPPEHARRVSRRTPTDHPTERGILMRFAAPSAALGLAGCLLLLSSSAAQVKIPPDLTFPQGKDSPGPVTFSHAFHTQR